MIHQVRWLEAPVGQGAPRRTNHSPPCQLLPCLSITFVKSVITTPISLTTATPPPPRPAGSSICAHRRGLQLPFQTPHHVCVPGTASSCLGGGQPGSTHVRPLAPIMLAARTVTWRLILSPYMFRLTHPAPIGKPERFLHHHHFNAATQPPGFYTPAPRPTLPTPNSSMQAGSSLPAQPPSTYSVQSGVCVLAPTGAPSPTAPPPCEHTTIQCEGNKHTPHTPTVVVDVSRTTTPSGGHMEAFSLSQYLYQQHHHHQTNVNIHRVKIAGCDDIQDHHQEGPINSVNNTTKCVCRLFPAHSSSGTPIIKGLIITIRPQNKTSRSLFPLQHGD